jgi:hypothetical protein
LQEEWLPKLQEVVGQINASFAANFAQIGCAGEVLLSQHEDYDKFSIQVRPHDDKSVTQVDVRNYRVSPRRAIACCCYCRTTAIVAWG